MGRKKKEKVEVIKVKKEKKEKKPAYHYDIGDIVIYLGQLYPQHHNKESTIINKSKKHKREQYKVKFADSDFPITVAIELLKKKENDIIME